MAWFKEIERLDNGAVASYWEVISIHYSHIEQTSRLIVGGWVNQEAYEGLKEPLMTKDWEIASGLAPQLSAGALIFVSGFAKSQPEFEGWTNE